MMKKFFCVLAISVATTVPTWAAVTGVNNIDLSSGPYTFSPKAGVSFTLSYAPTAPFDFNPVYIQTSGTAEVSSFGGFLGIPLQPSTFFTRANIEVGPNLFTQFASYASPTAIPYSLSPSDLALRYSVGADFFYGYARFAGPDLISLGFETLANTPITAGDSIAAGVPEPSTWAMMLLGFAGLGYVGFTRRQKVRIAS